MPDVKRERLAELPLLEEALDEWGCTDPQKRADAVAEFLASDRGLAEYLDMHIAEPMGSA